MKLAFAAAFLVLAVGTAHAHPCDQDAIGKATPLLRFHFEDEQADVGIDDTVKQLASIKALSGKGKYDVLEVWGHIYKADYRMRFIYAQIPGECLLMGQEVIEGGDPY